MRPHVFILLSFTLVAAGCSDDAMPAPMNNEAGTMDAQPPPADAVAAVPDATMTADGTMDATPSTPDAAMTPDATPDAMPGCTPGIGTMMVGTAAIHDNATCLTWTTRRQAEGMRWTEIRRTCAELTLEGFDDWRMPTTEEALTWPIAAVSPTFYDAVLTAPRYVPMGTPASGVEGQFHVCAVAWYSGAAPACYWWGPANTNGTFCVRGAGVGLPTISESCGMTCARVSEWERVAD